MELGIAYELEGPDGTRIVFGNSDAAQADPDYVGYLDSEQGISGLDSPEVRESTALVAAGDGGIHYDFLHGRRPLVVNGIHRADVAIGAHIALEQKIKRATNAMRADALLRWTNTGYPERRLAVRRNGPPRVGLGRRPKAFQLELVDADYRILSELEHDGGAQASGVGIVVNNAGDELATPRFVLTGPLDATIRIRNTTTGLEIRFKAGFALGAGEVLEVDLTPPHPRVELDGAPAYAEVDFLPSSWWGLVAGNNNVDVLAGAGAGTWRIYHRDAWI